MQHDMISSDVAGGTIARLAPQDGLALYIHWPFCLSKCPYCDFNSHVFPEIPLALYVGALQREMAHEATRLGKRRLTSIFFGGGTPSLMRPEDVARLITEATRLFQPVNSLEVTLEANPTSTEQARLAAIREAGVNRVSLGVQSLDDAALKRLGRQHDADEAICALEMARHLFDRVSFDLIYARPGQTISAWREELHQALTLASDHLSLYQLTIEPGTKFEAEARQGRLILPDGDEAARFYEVTGEIAALHGLKAYEVSNYARPGAESRHNLAYWRYDDYLGIGPGAHSRLTRVDPDGDVQKWAVRRHRAPSLWLEQVNRAGHGTKAESPLTGEARAREALLMGLRLQAGLTAESFSSKTGRNLTDCLDATILEATRDEGYLTYENGQIAATDSGRIRLEALLAALVL